MLTIAFCSHQESMINCLPQEFIKAFSRRGIDINTLTIRNSCDLSDYALHGIYPDIIIFSESVLSTDFINSFLLLKEQKIPNLLIIPQRMTIFSYYNLFTASLLTLFQIYGTAFVKRMT